MADGQTPWMADVSVSLSLYTVSGGDCRAGLGGSHDQSLWYQGQGSEQDGGGRALGPDQHLGASRDLIVAGVVIVLFESPGCKAQNLGNWSEYPHEYARWTSRLWRACNSWRVRSQS